MKNWAVDTVLLFGSSLARAEQVIIYKLSYGGRQDGSVHVRIDLPAPSRRPSRS